jgi:hypothetical protein
MSGSGSHHAHHSTTYTSLTLTCMAACMIVQANLGSLLMCGCSCRTVVQKHARQQRQQQLQRPVLLLQAHQPRMLVTQQGRLAQLLLMVCSAGSLHCCWC